MKKIGLVFLLAIFVCSSAFAQLVVGKYEGKNVKLKYIKGNPDIITSLEYELVTELKNQMAALKSEKNKLNADLDNLTNKNKSLQNEIDRLNAETKGGGVITKGNEAEIDSLKTIISNLQSVKDKLTNDIEKVNQNESSASALLAQKEQELANLKKELDKVKKGRDQKRVDYLKSSASFGLSYAPGYTDLSGEIIGNGIWNEKHKLSNQFNVFMEFKQLSEGAPLALGLGLGISSFKLEAGFSSFNETVEGQNDIDGDNYTAICAYSDVKENLSLAYLDIPLYVSLGVPRSGRISAYCKIGITPSINIQKRFEGVGKSNISGFYADGWNVTLHDIDELPFNSNGSCYENDVEYKVNPLVVWGNISGGVYIPLSNYKANNDARLIFKMGAKLDYSITSISKPIDEAAIIKDATYRLNQVNILAGKGTRILSPRVEIGLIYLFANPKNYE